VLHRLLTAPEQRDWHCVISMGDEGIFGPRLRDAGVTVHALGMQGAGGMVRGLPRLYRLLRELRPDVVQTWMYHADLVGGLAARAAGIRAVAWGIRNSGADLEKSSRSARICMNLCAPISGMVPGVIVACAEQARRMHQRAGYRGDRMLVIPNGYDLSRWRPDPAERAATRAAWGVDENTPVIGSVARFNPLKDHENLIGAFAHGLRTRPDLRCVLIGEGMDASNGALGQLLDRHGVRDNVILMGRRDDVPALMNGLDVHVLSSRAEGFPNVVAEAMASEVLCVVTDVGDAASMVGDIGWVVPPRNAAALGAAITSAIDVLGQAEQVDRAAAGRSRVEACYSQRAMVQAYHVVWRRLAQDYPTRGVPALDDVVAGRESGQLDDAQAAYAAWSLADADTACWSEQPARESPSGEALGQGSAGMAGSGQGRRLLMAVNNPAFFLSHRLPVALGAKAAGYDVHIATMDGPSVPDILRHGLRHHTIPMSRSGRNPLGELRTIHALYRLFRELRPDVVHGVTIKPMLYGGIAARLARVPAYVAAVSGLGFIFTRSKQGFDALRAAATVLYRLALGHGNSRVIFQNENDRDVLRKLGVVRSGQVTMIRGSGVDLEHFRQQPEPEGPPVAIMACRLLEDKGVREFVEAARLTAGDESGLRWVLVGSPDPGNPASITQRQFEQWRREGVVECLGERDDVADLYARSHIVVLPSYREGLPKSLVEAAAAGRAVVTTDVPGCRDAIVPGTSGVLVPPRDARALADAVLSLARDATLRRQMGDEGRRLAEREFDVRNIVDAHLRIYEALTAPRG
jgi:glycosyltransferase involved in cell wall biosynthesis